MCHLHAMCPAHHQPDLLHRQPLHRARFGQPPRIQRREHVRHFQQFIQVLADHHHCSTGAGAVQNGLPDRRRRRRIHAPGRLVDHDDRGRLVQLSPHQEFLQIAARQRPRRHPRPRRAHVVFGDHFLGIGPRPAPVDEPAPGQPLAHPRGQKGVLDQAHVRRRRMAIAVLGGRHQPGPPPINRPQIAHRLARDPHPVRCHLQLARQGQQQLVLTIARHPGNPQHLALGHREADPLQAGPERNRTVHRQVRNPQRHLALLARPPLRRGQGRPHHQLGHLPRRPVARGAGRHHLAAPQDRRLVTQGADFLQLVRDIQDRRPLRRQLPQGAKQDLHLLRRQHRCRLVHDQQLRVLQQTANDLHPLPLARRQITDHAGRVQRQPVFLAHRPDTRRQFPHRWRVFHPQRHVLRHIQRLEQAEMLKHHRHAQPPRLGRFRRAIGLAAKAHLAAVGPHQPVDHLHQRRFARAILAQKRMHLALGNGERHIAVGHHARIGLGHAIHPQKFGHARFSPCATAP